MRGYKDLESFVSSANFLDQTKNAKITYTQFIALNFEKPYQVKFTFEEWAAKLKEMEAKKEEEEQKAEVGLDKEMKEKLEKETAAASAKDGPAVKKKRTYTKKTNADTNAKSEKSSYSKT